MPERVREVHGVFAPLQDDVATVFKEFDIHKLSAIPKFLARTTDVP